MGMGMIILNNISCVGNVPVSTLLAPSHSSLYSDKLVRGGKTFLFLFVLLIAFVFVHEFTHVALNNFEVSSFCFFDCAPMVAVGILGNKYTPIGVQLIEPSQPLAKNEFVANLAGLSFLMVAVGSFLLRIKSKETFEKVLPENAYL